MFLIHLFHTVVKQGKAYRLLQTIERYTIILVFKTDKRNNNIYKNATVITIITNK